MLKTAFRRIRRWLRRSKTKKKGLHLQPLGHTTKVLLSVFVLSGLFVSVVAENSAVSVEPAPGASLVSEHGADVAGPRQHSAADAWATPLVLKILEHLGAGIVVAVFVAFLFHLREFSELFTKLARDVLIDHAYLKTLDADQLRQLRLGTTKVLIERSIHDQFEQSRYLTLSEACEAVSYGKVMPGQPGSSGRYRSDYYCSATYERLKGLQLKVQLQRYGLDTAKLDKILDDVFYALEVEITKYRLHDPEEESYSLIWGYEATALSVSTDVAHDCCAHLFLLEGDNAVRRIPLSKTAAANGSNKEVYSVDSTKPESSIPVKNGVVEVAIRSVAWNVAGVENFKSEQFAIPTLNADVTHVIVGFPEGTAIKHDLFGMRDSLGVPPESGSRVRVRHEGWLLPPSGYIFWWS